MGQMSAKHYWNTCATPGAVYGTDIRANGITLKITLPAPALKGLSDERRHHLIRSLHYAILPVIEGIYQEKWCCFAGKKVNGDEQILPGAWAELFTNREPE